MAQRIHEPLLPAAEREELTARYERTGWRRAVLAALTPAVVSLALFIPGYRVFAPAVEARSQLLILLASLPYAAACIWHARVVSRRLMVVVDRGLDGQLDRDQLRAYVASLPVNLAVRAGLYWLGLLPWTLPSFIVLSVWTTDHLVALLLLALPNSLAGALLTYLVIERTTRELRAIVMRGAHEPSARRIRLSGRFVVSYTVSTVVPLLVLTGATGIAVLNDVVESVPPYVAIFCLIVVSFGLAFTLLTARSVTEPVDVLRRAATRVGMGDLDVEVAVDDSGEIGTLQVQFNRMVAGLRDRERVRDLFGRHVGGDVAEKALAAAPNLDGEVRKVSAMFVDVIGSTSLAHSTPPSEVVVRLNAFFEAVVRNVALEGGSVNQFQGDGAVCIFGAPLDQPDHAARALRCAARLARDLQSLDGIEGRIGVSTGEAVAGNVGTLDRYGYTVIGDPVNEASRLCDAARETPARVLVSAASYAAAASPSDWEEAGMFELKGRSVPTCAYSLSSS